MTTNEALYDKCRKLFINNFGDLQAVMINNTEFCCFEFVKENPGAATQQIRGHLYKNMSYVLAVLSRLCAKHYLREEPIAKDSFKNVYYVNEPLEGECRRMLTDRFYIMRKLKINKAEWLCVQFIKENPLATRRQIAKHANISNERASSYLRGLLQKGYLRRKDIMNAGHGDKHLYLVQ